MVEVGFVFYVDLWWGVCKHEKRVQVMSGQENIMYAYVHKAVLVPQAFKLLPFPSTRTKKTLESSEL